MWTQEKDYCRGTYRAGQSQKCACVFACARADVKRVLGGHPLSAAQMVPALTIICRQGVDRWPQQTAGYHRNNPVLELGSISIF